jgi:hypothetical protein
MLHTTLHILTICILSSCRLLITSTHLSALYTPEIEGKGSRQLMKLGQWRYVGFGPKEPTEPMLGTRLLLTERKTLTRRMV